MDPTSVGFVILMVLLAGTLCYAGDLLGRKLGKKRLTILGLRPRHTAALFTALFGGLSTLIIILILGAASADVRVWITEGNRARVELQQTRKELDNIKAQRSQLQGEKDKLALEKDQAAKDLAGQKALVAQANADVKRLTDDTKKLASEAKQFGQQVASARAEVNKVKAEYDKISSDLGAVKVNRDQLVKQNGQLSEKNTQLINLNATLDKTLKDLNAEVETLRKSREKLADDLKKAQDTFAEAIGKNNEELKRVTDELQKAGDDLDAVQKELDARKTELENIKTELRIANQDLRMKPLRVNRGDELARIPLGPHLNLAESRRALVLAVSLSSDEAKRRGAALVPGTDDYASFIDLPTVPVIRGEEQMARAISQMIDQPRPKLLIMRSLVNTFEGEFVPVEVEIVENPIIYTKDQLVDEFEVDGSKSEQEIASVIADRASTVIRDKALKAGIIPAIGRPQSIGELGRETVINLVQGIKTLGRRVQVRLYALDETRAGDVLRLTYKIR
jgi:uncharacterized coiled-coil DUF342 family protein